MIHTARIGRRTNTSLRAGMFVLAGTIALAGAPAHASGLPAPALDEKPGATNSETITLAGGCFWGLQTVFQHMKGVTHTEAGYAGGSADTAHYPTVSTGETGHAESVQVTYNPTQVTLGQILQVYFSVAHDPTELNHQGPDHGTQYRSEIFYTSPEQQKVAQAYIDQLQAAHSFRDPVVTKLEPLQGFYAAEDYHQDYAEKHPDNPYILFNDRPKVAALEKIYPQLCTKP